MKFIFLIFTVVLTGVASAQKPVDTSYTVSGTYRKEIKKYPFVKVASRPLHHSVVSVHDEIYAGSRKLHFDAFFNKQGINPMVILIHGGGWKSGNKSQMHILAGEIAAKGYACFCIEYRLSGEASYPAGIHDVMEAVSFLKANAAKFNADPSRVAVAGCSSGGQMAALIGTLNKKALSEDEGLKKGANVNAVINMDGIVAFHHPESEEGGAAAQWLGGSYDESPEIWRQASPLTHAGKHTPPILFINSDKPRFHAGRDDMIAVLKRHGVYSDVKYIEGSPHSFWFFDPWFDQVVTWSVEFLDKILKNK